MYVIETEIRNQFEALAKTVQELLDRQGDAREALRDVRTLCVLGCGSSFSIAKSAAMLFCQHTGIPAYALPAGDVLVNFDTYKKMLADATLLLLSRSGETSEVVLVAERCREEFGCRILSICAKADAPAERTADWSLCLPWAFDEAVCQTRTVSNLYMAALGLAWIAEGKGSILEAFQDLRDSAAAFCSAQEELLSAVAQESWTKAVVLGDSGMAGLLEEGALAFKEICRRDSNHYHLLDVRHGPIVQIEAKTLVIAMLSSGERSLQKAVLADLSVRTRHLLVLDSVRGDDDGIPGIRIVLPECGTDEVRAIFALYCIQQICLSHAIARGVDPDRPKGLDSWISL